VAVMAQMAQFDYKQVVHLGLDAIPNSMDASLDHFLEGKRAGADLAFTADWTVANWGDWGERSPNVDWAWINNTEAGRRAMFEWWNVDKPHLNMDFNMENSAMGGYTRTYLIRSIFCSLYPQQGTHALSLCLSLSLFIYFCLYLS
jgi:hypothetical protein